MLIPRLPERIYYILAVVFPKITKKGDISIHFNGQVTHYFHRSGQGTQVRKYFTCPPCIMAVPHCVKDIGRRLLIQVHLRHIDQCRLAGCLVFSIIRVFIV